jgi:hypothetical protein
MNRASAARVACFVTMVLLAGPTAGAQDRVGFVSSAEVRRLFNQYLAPEFRERLIGDLAYRVDELNQAFGWLQRARIPAQVPASLVRGLRVDFEALSGARTPPEIRHLAVDDLIMKGEFCRRAPEGLGAHVPVSVRTLLKTAEEKGWEVVYKTAVEAASDAIPPTPFPNISSPTIENFTVGRFIVWARDPQQRDRGGERKDLIVDGRQKAQTLDLTVPAQK